MTRRKRSIGILSAGAVFSLGTMTLFILNPNQKPVVPTLQASEPFVPIAGRQHRRRRSGNCVRKNKTRRWGLAWPCAINGPVFGRDLRISFWTAIRR